MIRYGKLLATTVGLSTCAMLGAIRASSPAPVAAQASGSAQAPTFQVDPLWPKPLPNHWILGSVTGVWVDAQDHIWLVHRGLASLTARTEAGLATDPPTAETCCAPAPPVLEFDQAGTLVEPLGRPWPGIRVAADAGRDRRRREGQCLDCRHGAAARGGCWRSSQPAPAQDAHLIKFTRAGKFLLQIGRRRQEPGRLTARPHSTDRPPSRSTPAATRSTSPTAWPSSCRRLRQRDRRLQAPLGRVQREAGKRARDESIGTPNLRQDRQGRPRLRLRSPEQSRSGVQEGRHIRQGSRHRQRDVG